MAPYTDRDILPGDFKPAHYDLVLRDLHFTAWTYKGTVRIHGQLLNPTTELVLNALRLTFVSASITVDQAGSSQTYEATGFTDHVRKQRVSIVFSSQLPASPVASLAIEFAGVINDEMAGFSRSQFKPDVPMPHSPLADAQAGTHHVLSTMFEACDARRAFPCFDEPSLKATFEFSVEVPQGLTALSNMPVKVEQEVAVGGSDEYKKKLVSFDRSPVMSTYLLAWAVGDFEYIEAVANADNGRRLPIRIYTPPGSASRGQFALEHVAKIIHLFFTMFGIAFPLPKSDIVAIPEFACNAMEHWGLIMYRPARVLFDPVTSDSSSMQVLLYVLSHELAHQWFGNLVTMDWWDELWLNEGFATWAGWTAVNHLKPQWDVWAKYQEDDAVAFGVDGVRASHPVQVPIHDALDVNQIFDDISYLKGCAVIRMLARKLGERAFLAGVARYLQANAYGNAKAEALWQALSDVSGVQVAELMRPWIEQPGFPVLTVTEERPGERAITVRQSRFLSTGDVVPEDDATVWWVPLGLRGRTSDGKAEALDMTTKEMTITGIGGVMAATQPSPTDLPFYLLNAHGAGFYLVHYPPDRLRALASPEQMALLTEEDKVFITGSTAELALAGRTSAAALLGFIAGFREETGRFVLSRALDCVAGMASVFGGGDAGSDHGDGQEKLRVDEGLRKFTLRLIERGLEHVGFWPGEEVEAEGRDLGTILLRKKLLLAAIECGHEEITHKAHRLFTSYQADPLAHPLPGAYRLVAYTAAVRVDPVRATPAIKREWAATTAVDGKELCLAALARVADVAVLRQEVIPFLFGLESPPPSSPSTPPSSSSRRAPSIPSAPAPLSVDPGDMHFLVEPLAAHNHAGRALLWNAMREHWSGALAARTRGNLVVLERLVKFSLRAFADEATGGEIEAFFGRVGAEGFDMTLRQLTEQIRGRARYRKRDMDKVQGFLVEQGYT